MAETVGKCNKKHLTETQRTHGPFLLIVSTQRPQNGLVRISETLLCLDGFTQRDMDSGAVMYKFRKHVSGDMVMRTLLGPNRCTTIGEQGRSSCFTAA